MTYPDLPALPNVKLLKSLDDEQADEIFNHQEVVVCRRVDRDGTPYGEPGPDPSFTAARIRSSLGSGSSFSYTIDQPEGDGWLNGKTTAKLLPHPYGVVLRFEELVERFEALAKRARRIGVEEPGFEVLAERQLPARFGGVVTATLIRINETPPVKFEGWTFVATVEHDPEVGFNVVRSVPSAQALPLTHEQAWTASNTCDHCGTDRKRNETFVVRHEDGRVRRVGRSCLKDFTGHKDPARLVQLVELERLIYAARDDEPGEPPPQPLLSEFLAYVAQSIRTLGWLSRSAAREHGSSSDSTADKAAQQLWYVFKEQLAGKSVPAEDCPSDDDRARAAEALAWVRGWNFDTLDNDYRRNLYAACLREVYNPKTSGLVASAVSSHARELERELERRSRGASLANSEYLGRVGDKLGRKLSKKDKDNGVEGHPAWTATVSGLREFESDWGVSILVSLRDEAGNAAAWWSSRTPRLNDTEANTPVEVGDVVVVVGTVKKVEEYIPRKEGATAYKQTTLTRVVLTRAEA